MTLYGIDSKERRVVAIVIGGVAIGCAYLLSSLLEALGRTIPWWVDAPSVMGFYSILYLVFDVRMWRLASKWRIVSVPDLNGVWSGVVKSSHDGHQAEHPISVRIKQTWSRMSVVLEASKSRSHSVVIGLATENLPFPRLVYEYVSRPASSATRTMEMHEGTTVLDLGEIPNHLEGYYYTGRGRENHGEIALDRHI